MAALGPHELSRYSRHIQLPQFGLAGQTKLKAARVLVIGAGGLGSPAALYLAAAGVGTLGIVDFDTVERHNLQRQLLHDESTIGWTKTRSALHRLRQLNPHVELVEHTEPVSADNALSLFSNYDVVVDGTDNFGSRYLNNDAAVLAGRPLIYGSIFMFSGQVSVFDPRRGGSCYRCLFPEPPPPGSVPSCGEAGVLGAVCGFVGSLQALEAIKCVTGVGDPLIGRLLLFDGLAGESQVVNAPRSPTCAVCGSSPQIRRLEPERYAAKCELPVMNGESSSYPLEIDVQTAHALLGQAGREVRLIDVREPFEWEICRVEGSQHLPLRQIPEAMAELPRDTHLLMLCHHGGRSERATRYLRQHGFTAVTNVAGGIDAWARELDPSLTRY